MGRRKKRLEKRQHIEKPGKEEGSYSFKRFSMKRKILLQGSNITMSVLILVIDHLLERRRYTSARTSIWFFLLHDSSGAYIVLFPKNTITAWNNALSWSWENAMSELQETLYKVSSSIVKFPKQAPPALILSSHNIPSKLDWNIAVNKALQMIERNDSWLSKFNYISIVSLLLPS
ncbi:isochorismate synthase [Trifolium repens]|nr:isochorismate synthase [Trifolium repens]